MPRIRSLKPEHPGNRKIGRLSDRAYRLWTSLICQADDEGRRLWDPDEFRALLYAYQPRVTTAMVAAAMQELQESGLATLYSVGDRMYYQLHDWHDHQRIAHPTPSTIPPMSETGCLIHEDSGTLKNVRPDRKGLEGNGKDLEWKGGEGVSQGLRAAPAVPANLRGWLLRTKHLPSLADAKHAEFWSALERAYDQYAWLYFEDEINKADAWIEANPPRKPTLRGLPRFIRNWFDRAVEIGRRRQGAQGQAKR